MLPEGALCPEEEHRAVSPKGAGVERHQNHLAQHQQRIHAPGEEPVAECSGSEGDGAAFARVGQRQPDVGGRVVAVPEDPRGVVGGAAAVSDAGGVRAASKAMMKGFGAGSACEKANAPPAATLPTTGTLLAAVASVSTAAAATKPRNSRTGSHCATCRARAFTTLMLNTPRPGR